MSSDEKQPEIEEQEGDQKISKRFDSNFDSQSCLSLVTSRAAILLLVLRAISSPVRVFVPRSVYFHFYSEQKRLAKAAAKAEANANKPQKVRRLALRHAFSVLPFRVNQSHPVCLPLDVTQPPS